MGRIILYIFKHPRHFLLKKVYCILFLCLSFSYADTRISDTFKRMQVHDVNSDGELNCIDYTVCFKYTWDMCYTKDDCIIIRNRNKNFHHLFIGVLSDNNLIYVEPQGSCDNYLLRSWWPDFDEQYNIYYETFIWLYIYTDGWLYEKEVQ